MSLAFLSLLRISRYILLNNETEFPGFLVGIILTIIAIVYQRGVVLTQEAELTI